MVAQLDLSDRAQPEVMPHLKPLCTAIDMVFGSAAALSATFGFKVLFLPSAPSYAKLCPLRREACALGRLHVRQGLSRKGHQDSQHEVHRLQSCGQVTDVGKPTGSG